MVVRSLTKTSGHTGLTQLKTILNSVKSMEHKTSVTNTLSFIENESIEIRLFDIVNSLKSGNSGKACGVDGLAAEHVINADERIHVILSILFNCFISHGYFPSGFMKPLLSRLLRTRQVTLVTKIIIAQ